MQPHPFLQINLRRGIQKNAQRMTFSTNPSIANIPRATPESHPWQRRWLGTRSYWIAQLIGWSGIVAVLAASIYSSTKKSQVSHELICTALWAGLGVLFTHLLRVMLIYYRGQRLSWAGLLARLGLWTVAVNLALTLATVLLVYGLVWVTGSEIDHETEGQGLDVSDLVIANVVSLIPWLSLYFGINYYRGYQQSTLDRLRLEAAVKDAELRLLRAQVDPHFLFNSLNTLRALVPPDFATPQELATARDAITLLSEVLRTSLGSGTSYTVPLSEELAHVENYLSLEKLRFESRLQFTQTIAPATLPCLVPTLLLQTLVENAIKYGIATSERGGRIELNALLDRDHLLITVTNPGTLNSAGTHTGVGLKNARARLALIFGSAATLDLTQVEPDRVRASVQIPTSPPQPLPAIP